jgi:hypothetical protein
LFYAGRGDTTTYTKAKEMCNVCPVIDDCWNDMTLDEYGVQHSEVKGFRAGLTPKERIKAYCEAEQAGKGYPLDRPTPRKKSII